MASSPVATGGDGDSGIKYSSDNRGFINVNLNRIVSDYLEKRGLYKSLKIF